MLILIYVILCSNCFQVYMLGLLENLYKHTGFTDNPNDPQLTVYKRVNILNWACSLGYDDCVRNSVLQFQNWRSSPDPDRNNPQVSHIFCLTMGIVFNSALQAYAYV
jgi:hypothetical protein